jgi:hypothetical protein
MLSTRVIGASLLVPLGVTFSPAMEGTTACAPRPVSQERTVLSAQATGRSEIRRCAKGPVDNYLSERWQQCWFDAPRGRWRTLNHELHYDVLVVEVEAAGLGDADEIARRFVTLHRDRFSEILIYVQAETTPIASRIVRRVRWARKTGFETLEFTAPPRR